MGWAGKGIKLFRKENIGKESKYWRWVKEQRWRVNKRRDEKQTGAQKETKWLLWEQGPRQKEMRAPRERKRNTTDLVLILLETEPEEMGGRKPRGEV